MKALLSGLAVLVLASRALAAPEITVEVDAREIARSLLHARMEIPAVPGELVLWYPKWIPGVHAPGGPVQNLAGLRFETPKGEPITWLRDEEEPFRFHVRVPAGVDRVVARLDYICNQPSTNSSGVDSFGNSQLGVVNWNTLLLYPENASIDSVRARMRLTLPAGWQFGTALKPERLDEAPWDAKAPPVTPQGKPYTVSFQAESLRRVVDCPLICGEHFRTFELTGKGTPPAYLHLVSESAAAIALDDKLVARYRALVAEAVALFGGAPFADYHFLVVCSDQLPTNGLEHLSGSFNSVGERELIDEKKRKSWPAYLLPHEFVHSWCGKYRRPAGMVTANFHTTERTRLLWVYEGLTQYLGEVLTLRSGLLKPEEYLPALSEKIDQLNHQTGRKWRSLEDTAVASWQLRGRSTAWAALRRSQDYYNEGLLIWLEADAIIREQSGGRRSLDDFCKKFFAPGRAAEVPTVAPYEITEITGLLKGLADYDWDKFFKDRVGSPQPSLNLAFVEKLGYRLQYNAKPSEYLAERDKDRKSVSAASSLGLSVGEDGKIGGLVPGALADQAGLASGQVVVGVNGRKYSSERFKEALADSATRGKVELLLLDGDLLKNVELTYAEGPKYLELTRIGDRPDLLGAILKPSAPVEKKEEDGR